MSTGSMTPEKMAGISKIQFVVKWSVRTAVIILFLILGDMLIKGIGMWGTWWHFLFANGVQWCEFSLTVLVIFAVSNTKRKVWLLTFNFLEYYFTHLYDICIIIN